MNLEAYIEREIQKREEFGSSFTKEELYQLRHNLKILLSIPYENAFQRIVRDMEKTFTSFYHHSSTLGLSTHICTSYHTIGMYVGENIYQDPILRQTVFDIDSMASLFTIILTFQLSYEGFFSLQERVQDTLPSFTSSFTSSFTVLDLLKMDGALSIHTTDRILSSFLSKKVSEKIGVFIPYEKILKTVLLKPYHLDYTGYGKRKNTMGRCDFPIYEKKMGNLESVPNSSSLFSNGHDFALLSKALFHGKILSSKDIQLMYQKQDESERSFYGLSLKPSDFVPSYFSASSFASEGNTNSIVTFDFQYQIHNSFFVDVENGIDCTYQNQFKEFQREISYDTILLDCFDKIYQKRKHL